MKKLQILICEVDSEDTKHLREIARYDVEGKEVGELERATALDELEGRTERIGQAVKRKLLEAQWQQIDEKLAEAYGERFFP